MKHAHSGHYQIEREADRRRIACQPGFHREQPKVRALAHTLAVIGLLGLAVHATPTEALIIGGGWTADQPPAVTYPGVVAGLGTLTDAFRFTLKLSSAAGTATTIKFTNDGTTTTETFFNLTFEGMNTGVFDWTGMSIVIADKTEDTIPVEATTVTHPQRAHVHRIEWSEADSSHFKCVDAFCGNAGRGDMTLGLKGANPITPGNSTTGKILRLHDRDEGGAGTKPMKFDLTLTPIPEPATLYLLGTGLVGFLGYGWRRRKRASPTFA